MGKNKGKGAALLRRKNSIQKTALTTEGLLNNFHRAMRAAGFLLPNFEVEDAVLGQKIMLRSGQGSSLNYLTVEYKDYYKMKERKMNKYQSFAVNHHLNDYPEDWGFERIIDELKSGCEGGVITENWHYENVPLEDLAALIEDMYADLRLVFK